MIISQTPNLNAGRVMGGGTSINVMIYVRGNKEDYNNWAKLGNKGWDYSSVLPYFMKTQNFKGKRLPGAGKVLTLEDLIRVASVA